MIAEYTFDYKWMLIFISYLKFVKSCISHLLLKFQKYFCDKNFNCLFLRLNTFK